MALAPTAPGSSGALDEEPIVILPAVPDPQRRARIAAWWQRFEEARPAVSAATVRLRREHRRWRERGERDGCRSAGRFLSRLDRGALLRTGDYWLTRDVGTALDELAGAAGACLRERYFEFDYRLQVGEAALRSARERAARQLAPSGD